MELDRLPTVKGKTGDLYGFGVDGGVVPYLRRVDFLCKGNKRDYQNMQVEIIKGMDVSRVDRDDYPSKEDIEKRKEIIALVDYKYQGEILRKLTGAVGNEIADPAEFVIVDGCHHAGCFRGLMVHLNRSPKGPGGHSEITIDSLSSSDVLFDLFEDKKLGSLKNSRNTCKDHIKQAVSYGEDGELPLGATGTCENHESHKKTELTLKYGRIGAESEKIIKNHDHLVKNAKDDQTIGFIKCLTVGLARLGGAYKDSSFPDIINQTIKETNSKVDKIVKDQRNILSYSKYIIEKLKRFQEYNEFYGIVEVIELIEAYKDCELKIKKNLKHLAGILEEDYDLEHSLPPLLEMIVKKWDQSEKEPSVKIFEHNIETTTFIGCQSATSITLNASNESSYLFLNPFAEAQHSIKSPPFYEQTGVLKDKVSKTVVDGFKPTDSFRISFYLLPFTKKMEDFVKKVKAKMVEQLEEEIKKMKDI